MIPSAFYRRVLLPSILLLLISCSGNVIQTIAFRDGFQDLQPGDSPPASRVNPAVYYDSEAGRLGPWKVASSLRNQGFQDAWKIVREDGENHLLQTFTNLDQNDEPLSLITHPMIVSGDSLWKDYTMEVEFTPLAKFDKCGVVFKFRHPYDFYFFGIEGNTVALKHIQQPVTPLRPMERILDVRPLVWNPGDRLHATVTVRRNRVFAVLNDTIYLHADGLPIKSGRIGLISDLPAMFHRVEVKILKGEQRKLGRRNRHLIRRREIRMGDYPEMVRWRKFDTGDFGTDQNIRFGDLTGDGNKEIVFAQPGPGGRGIGRITALTMDGEILWSKGDLQSNGPAFFGDELPIQVHDVDGDGNREVIYISDKQVTLLEGSTGETERRKELQGTWDPRAMVFGDLSGTGSDDCLILSDREHHILALNSRLETMWEQQTDRGSQPLIYDLNNDGRDEVVMGFTTFTPEGNLKFDVGAFIGDQCNGAAIHELIEANRSVPCLVYAAGDWGLLFVDFRGNLLKQEVLGHVRYITVADFDTELPGLEVVTSNQWGSDGLTHLLDASGKVKRRYHCQSGSSRCRPVNWKGDGEEFFITSADSLSGGLFDGEGELAVGFPEDGHPETCYMIQDLTGDTRDEIVVWDRNQLWIYTQDDNPRMGKTYAPARIAPYNHSTMQMSYSFPGW